MEFFGISGSELLLILVVGVIVIGPKHAAQALLWFKGVIEWLRAWSARLREEANFTKSGLNVDLKNFDPREYDPRKMIKDAVAEEMQLWMEQATSIEKAATPGLVPEKTPDNPNPSTEPKPDEPPAEPPTAPRQEKPA
ncbi:translocase [uncultured Mobiluncus sp.]|uniref:translocase n=1 Tax=uncultured Mobiluncus sp. TaxID=293425 RepID=UPI002620A2D3|nr:translocase [uncultured Mobiluncus sp.]